MTIFKLFGLLVLSSFIFCPVTLMAKGTPAILVEKTTITKEKIDSLVDMLSKSQYEGRVLSKEEYNYLEKAVAGNLIGQELLILESDHKQIKTSAKEIDSMLALFKSGFESDADFKTALAQVGDTENSLKDKLKKEMKIKNLLSQRLTALSKPSDEEMKKYFNQHKKDFPKNDTLRACQIVLKAPKNDVESGEESRKKLENLRFELENETTLEVLVDKFMRVAANISETPEAKLGGDLRRFHKGDFLPEFNDAIKDLNVGQMSQVFRTPIGVHLVLLLEKNDGSFENSKLTVLQKIISEKTRKNQIELEKYMQELLKKYTVKYLNDRYKGDVSVNLNEK